MTGKDLRQALHRPMRHGEIFEFPESQTRNKAS
jgi:hypothetical protein